MLNNTNKLYKINLVAGTFWQNKLDLIIAFLNKNFEKVVLGVACCEFKTFKVRNYVHFYFYENFKEGFIDSAQFTGTYIE